jgi:acyl-CoA thioester hydrolase
VRVASIGTKSFVMEYAIYRGGSEDLIASGRSVLVTYDYAAGKSVPVPEAFRAAVGMGNG